ncbi:hypothetical protein J4458_06245 [Candidatus Woesearchaeota archaeon]|nr:hypothetical protein [Candidatus Woesearchaeota archaeon]
MHYKNNKKVVLLLAFLLLIVILAGCKNSQTKGAKSEQAFTGTQGLVVNFLPNNPPDKLIADSNQVEIPILIEVRNRGTYPAPDKSERWSENDVIFLSGFDPKLIPNWRVDNKDSGEENPKISLSLKSLEGKNILNPEGGYDSAEFVGSLDISNLKIDRYKPSFLVTACYNYVTRATPTVCIDPNPFSLTKEKKICDVKAVSLTNQGAPVAVTRIEEEILRNSFNFKIYFKNVGGGDVIAVDKLNRCAPAPSSEKLDRKDIDLVKIVDVKLSDESIKDSCKPVAEVDGSRDYARLFNNEGFIVCSAPKREEIKTAFTTPLSVELLYGYRNSISKTVEIINVPTG